MKHVRLLAFFAFLSVLFCAHFASSQGWDPTPRGGSGGGGSGGVSAATTTTQAFTQPAAGSNVTINVTSGSWAVAGQSIYVGASSVPAFNSPQFVQVAQVYNPSTPNPQTVTFTNPVAAGDITLVGIGCLDTNGITSVTDDKSNGYAVIIPFTTFNSQHGAVYASTNATPGASTISVNWTSVPDHGGLVIEEWSKMTATSDGTSFSTSATNTVNSGNVTTTQANDLLFSFLAFGDNNVNAGDASYTLRTSFVTNPTDGAQDKVATTTGAYGSQWSMAANGNMTALLAAFKATSSNLAGGYYTVVSSTASTITVTNPGYATNAPAGSGVGIGAGVSPGGPALLPPNEVQTIGSTVGAANSFTLSAPTITKKRSGTFLVTANGSVDGGSGFFYSLVLQLDGVNLTGNPQGGASVNGPATHTATASSFATVNDFNSHTFSAVFTGVGGTIAVSTAGRTQILVQEL